MDRIFAIMALAAFIAFLAVVVGFVPDLDLIIVFVFVIALAVWDFWQAVGPQRKNN